MTVPLRPLTLGELLDRTFQLYRRHFVVFAGIMALPQLIVLGLQIAQTLMEPGRPDPFDALGRLLLFLLVLMVVSLVVGTVAQAATVVAVSEFHLGRQVTIAQALGAIVGRIVGLCLITLAVGFLIGIGFVLCIVPGVLLGLRWALVVPAAVIERTTLSESMARSSQLTEGNRGRIFVIFLLYFVLSMVLSSLWQIPVFIAAVMAGRAGGDPGTLPLWAQLAAPIGGYVTGCLVTPLLTISLALVYYDERVRKEAFDLDHMMAQLDETVGPVGQPTAGV
jgi:hypothetical protein